MAHGAALLFDLIAHDGASPAFLKVAGAADKAAASTARAQKGMAGSAAAMGRSGAMLTKRVALPLAALGAVSVVQAAKYQKSMTLIGTITDQTSKQMASTSKGLLSVAKATGTSLEQLSEGLYTVEKGGLRGAKALATVKAAAQGAKAENTDLATTTNALTSVMASYGKSLDDPVKAMNMIIKASGLSKTTMQDFANSLSNVVPVASSLGISFAEVGGAIATMTQHGESAQHATDNLRNLITNLAGQNNVASASLQQLGVNTTDLSKNLGKRGLTGSLDIVLAAINRHGKDGQIVTSAFKQAATATASLRTEINAMPKSMQANARAFDAGKMNYKDYLAYTKSLGGQQYAMARQFLGTEMSAKGFNSQLKSGNSTVRTLASTLQKSLGGVTGMNVALQLSGESADRFHEFVKEIGASASATKGDVLGWANTQGTLAVKLDKAKASLQVIAVEIGTALIPAVSKVVDWVGKGVGWFDKLSSTDKKIIGWSVGIIAAIGPLLAIFGRIGRVLALFSGGLAKVGVGSAVSAREVASSQAGQARAVVAAVEAQTLALRELIAMQTAAGASAVQMGRVSSGAMLASTRAYQRRAVASAVPMAGGGAVVASGAAPKAGRLSGISGGTALNSVLAVALLGKMGYDAGGSLPGGSTGGKIAGALGGGSSVIAKKLVDTLGIGSKGKRYKISDPSGKSATYSTETKSAQALIDVMVNGRKIIAAFGEAMRGGGKQAQANARDIALAAIQHSKLADRAKAAGLTEKDLTNAATGSSEAYRRVIAAWKAGGNPSRASLLALNKIREQYKQGKNAALLYADVHGQVIRAQRRTTDQTTVLSGKLGNLNRMNLTGGQAAGVYAQSLHSVTDSVAKNGKTLDSNTLFGQRNIATIRTAAAQSLAHAQAVYKQTGSIKLADAALRLDRQRLIETGAAAGLLPSKVNAVANALVRIPKDVRSKITVDTQGARDALSGFGSWFTSYISGLASKAYIPVRVGSIVGGSAKSNSGSLGGLIGTDGNRATGGIIRGPGTGTSDTAGVFALSNGEAVIPAKAVSRNRGLISSLISSGRAAASGGIVHSGKDWIYGGTRYASERAAQNAQTRAQSRRGKASADSVSNAISGIGQSATSPFSTADTGFARVRSTIVHAMAVLNEQIGKGLKKKLADGFRSSIQNMVKLANRQLSGLRAKIKGSDLAGIRNALKGTADDTRAAFSQILTDMKAAGAGSGALKTLRSAGSRLASAQSRLGSAREYRGTIADTLRGGFDPTQSGSISDFITGAKGATGRNQQYAAQVNKLRAKFKGNKSGLALVNTLAASGNSATLASLAGGSSRELSNAAKAYGDYNASVSAGSNAATTAKFGESVDSMAKRVDGIATAVGHLAAAFSNQKVTLQVGAHGISTEVVHSAEFKAALRSLARHIEAGS